MQKELDVNVTLKMSYDELVNHVLPFLKSAEEASVPSIVAKYVGADAIRGFLGMHGVVTKDNTLADSAGARFINLIFDEGLVDVTSLVKEHFALSRKKTNPNATFVDGYRRIADLGYTQVVRKMDISDKSEESTFSKVSAFVSKVRETSSRPEVQDAFLQDPVDGEVIIVSDATDRMIGVGQITDGIVDYSVSDKMIPTLNWDTASSAAVWMARLFASTSEFSSKGEVKEKKAVSMTDDYARLGQLDRLFPKAGSFSEVLAYINMLSSSIYAIAKHELLPPKGKGLKAEKWWFDAIKIALASGNERVKKAFMGFATSYSEARGKPNDVAVTVSPNRIRVTAELPRTEFKPKAGATTLHVKGKSEFDEALKLLKLRRNHQNEGEAGISGLTDHYAIGIKLPHQVLTVMAMASNIYAFTRIHDQKIGLAYIGKAGDYEMMLKALVYIKYKGIVCIAGPVGDLIRKHDVKKGTSEAISPFATDGKFGRGEFLLRSGLSSDIPTIYEVTYVAKDDVNYNTTTKAEFDKAKEYIDANVYMVNIPLTPSIIKGMDKNVRAFAHYETHNLKGFLTNCPRMIEHVDKCEKKLLANYEMSLIGKRVELMNPDEVIPVSIRTYNHYYYMSIIANTTRIQMVFTGECYEQVCNYNNLSRLPRINSNISGILSDAITIDGVSLEVLCNSEPRRKVIMTYGTDEQKALVSNYMSQVKPLAAGDANGKEKLVAPNDDEGAVPLPTEPAPKRRNNTLDI